MAPWTVGELAIIFKGLDAAKNANYTTTLKVVDTVLEDLGRSTSNGTTRTRHAVNSKLVFIANSLEIDGTNKILTLVRSWEEHKEEFVKHYLYGIWPEGSGQPQHRKTTLTLEKARREAAEESDVGAEPDEDQSYETGVGYVANVAPNPLREDYEMQDATLCDETADIESTAIDAADDMKDSNGAENPLATAVPKTPGVSSPLDKLTEGELKVIEELRRPPIRSYDGPVDHNEISAITTKILRSIVDAVKDYLSVSKPNPILTAFKLTEHAQELTAVLIPSERGKGVKERLQVLLDCPNISLNVVLQAYAAAALHKWVFEEGVDETGFNKLPIELSPSFRVLAQLVGSELVEKVRIGDMMINIEEMIVPSLHAKAIKLQHNFHEVVNSLCASTSEDHEEIPGLSDEVRRQKYDVYAHQVKAAFHEGLNLRVKMAKSRMQYGYEFPRSRVTFDKSRMKPANTYNVATAHGKAIRVCISPAVFSQERKGGSNRVLAMPALVMLEGLPMKLVLNSISTGE